MPDRDTQCDPAAHANGPAVWFSDRSDDVDQPAFCLVCWAYGETVTRHRAHPAA